MKSGLRPGVLILAGGKGSRCGGRDKGWLETGGEALIVRRLRELAGNCWPLAISANRSLDRYRALGVPVFVDATADFPGPLAAIDAAMRASFGDPLVTVPVDIEGVSIVALQRLLDASEAGLRPAYARDADGDQPLLAVWPSSARAAAEAAMRSDDRSVRGLQARLRAVRVEFPTGRFGNINTLADLERVERDSIGASAC